MNDKDVYAGTNKASVCQVQAQEQALSLKGVRPMIKKLMALLYKRAYNVSHQLFYCMANCKEKTLDTILRFVYDSRGEDNE